MSVINYARTYSGMQRDQRPQPKEVEAAVSVQTNEPAKKRLYDYAL